MQTYFSISKFLFILLVCLISLIKGLFKAFPYFDSYQALKERERLIEFAEKAPSVIINAPPRMGKTLLLSVVCRGLPKGYTKKVGFASNIPDAKALSHNDFNWWGKVGKEASTDLVEYFFVDEINYIIKGNEHQKNTKYNMGVPFLQQIIGHINKRLWISATREGHVGIDSRDLVNYHAEVYGLKHLMFWEGSEYSTLLVKFHDQTGKFVDSFNILIDHDSDFKLYNSFWLKNMKFFRDGKTLK